MASIECGVIVFREKILEVFSRLVPDLKSLVDLYASREEMQRRNRANLAAHLAYTKRKVNRAH